MKHFSLFGSSVMILLAVTLSTRGHAQTITGEIDGVVTDSLGAAVSQAAVTIVNADTGEIVRTVTTDTKGSYTAPLLQVGTYSVRIAVPGFAPRSVNEIEVSVSDILRVDLQLQPADQQVVNVAATNNNLAPQLEDAASNTIISGAEMRDLALNTRNFEQMVSLQPGVSFGGSSDQVYTGVVQPNGQSNNANQSINGLRATQNAWLLDGADMLSHTTGQQVAIFPSIEAIQQIKVLRNSYGAQYGGGGSAQIQLITKAGGSQYHGDLFFFFRNAVFNANSYFNKLAFQSRPQDNQYNSGLTFGGPLFIPHIYPRDRSHTFFFYSLDFHRDSVATVENLNNAPTLDELQGNFPTNVCTAYQANGTTCVAGAQTMHLTTIDPVAAAYVKDIFAGFPAVNNPNDPNGLILDQLGIHNETENLVRLDHTFSQRLSAFFRFVNDPIHIISPAGLNKAKGYPNMSTTDIRTTGTAYLGHATFALTPATIVDGAMSYMQYGIHAVPIGNYANAPDVKALLNLPFVSTLTVPDLSINSQSFGVTGPVSDESRTYQAFGNIFHGFGQHSVSAGVNFQHYSEVVNQGINNAGLYSFNGNGPTGSGTTSFVQSFANFLQGRATSFLQDSIDPIARPVESLFEAYVQDDWRIASRLTINLGVRYSFFKQPTEKGGHLGSFEPAYFNPTLAPTIDNTGSLCATAPCAGGGIPNPLYNPAVFNGLVIGGVNSPYGNAVGPQPYLNFAPRVGLAWNVFGDGKTSLRAGYGMYYNQTQLNVEQQTVFNNPAYVQVVTFSNPASLANPGTGTANAPLSAFGIDRNWKTPYTQAFSLSIQQQFPGRTLLEVGYSGNTSTHLIGEVDLNQPFPGQYIATGQFHTNSGMTAGGISCATAPASSPECNTVTNANTPLLNQIRPYRGYNTILDEATVFTANYHALQIALNKSFSPGSRVSVNYTWSHGLSTAGLATGAAPQNSYDLNAEYGPVSFDRRHVLTAHFVYDLPFYKKQHGWKGHLLGGYAVSGIVTAAAGLPLTVTTGGVDPAGQGILAPTSPEIGRQDCIGDVSSDQSKTRLNWFNTAHFVKVPNGRPGNCPNGNVRGPGYQVWNLDLFKSVSIRPGMRLQFRAEAFNVWNHTNWTAVDTAEVDKTFGTVMNARDPRQMQLGVKFIF